MPTMCECPDRTSNLSNDLEQAIRNQNIKQVKKLLEIVKPYYSHVELLASIKNKEVIKLVLDAYGSKAPHILISRCLREDNLELIKWILKNYPLTEDSLVTYQTRALCYGNIEAAKMFFKRGSRIVLNPDIIREISQSGSVKVLKFLIDNYNLKLMDIESVSLACFFIDHLKDWIIEKASEVFDLEDDEDKIRDL